MSVQRTVVFADIAGSTALFETLGNARAAALVTALTQTLSEGISAQGGRVVKMLGDGVLALFGDADSAVDAMVRCMRQHHERMQSQALALRQQVCVGLATGDVIEVDGDCYGDAVNLAARLCARAGHDEIWTEIATIGGVLPQPGVALIRLGHVQIRGRSEPLLAYRVQWRQEQAQEPLTVPGLPSDWGVLQDAPARIALRWGPANWEFGAHDGPLVIGRSSAVPLCIQDPRVSRQHARLQWSQRAFELTDLSSFGTWVRFSGSAAPVALRRDSCLLHGSGEIALGVPFTDASAPLLAFETLGAGLRLMTPA